MSKPRVAVIGAGLGGLCAAIKIKAAKVPKFRAGKGLKDSVN